MDLVVVWPLVILGVVFSGIGLARARSGVVTDSGLSIAGLAHSTIGLFVCLLYLTAFRRRGERLPHMRNQQTRTGIGELESPLHQTLEHNGD